MYFRITILSLLLLYSFASLFSYMYVCIWSMKSTFTFPISPKNCDRQIPPSTCVIQRHMLAWNYPLGVWQILSWAVFLTNCQWLYELTKTLVERACINAPRQQVFIENWKLTGNLTNHWFCFILNTTWLNDNNHLSILMMIMMMKIMMMMMMLLLAKAEKQDVNSASYAGKSSNSWFFTRKLTRPVFPNCEKI